MKKKYLIIGIVGTLLLCVGVSVAYFTANIIGEGKKITVTSKKLEVIFTDTEEITANEIEPGWEYTKTFTVENKTGKEFYYDISIKELINTFKLPYLEYEITSTSGYNTNGYREVPKNIGTLGRNIGIDNNEKHIYTIKFRYRNEEEIDQSEDMGKEFNGSLQITETPNIIRTILADNPVVLERTNFNETLGTSTPTNNTIYKADGEYTEDGSEVYYFAGNVSNNWVKFGQDENNNDLYWRIIRTNEDGSVRLLYAGTSPDTTEGYITVDGQSSFVYNNIVTDDPMYSGYMYGETSGSLENNRENTISSEAKTAIDTWYSRGLNVKTDSLGNKYDKYVSRTAIYCNDRSGDKYSLSKGEFNASYNRLLQGTPTYRCGMKPDKSGLYSDASIADKFTVSTKTGNGDLTYPVALITVDEIKRSKFNYFDDNNYNYYFLNNAANCVTNTENWWTMSPMYFSKELWTYLAIVYGSLDYGDISDDGLDSLYTLRPVLSLKSCVQIAGEGTSTEPYEVTIDSICANQEN